MLVGGGELHETFDSLVRTERPLSRGIQRFTGITQGDGRRRAAARGGAARAGRPARGAGAGGAQRALRPSRAAPGVRARGLDWPAPPVLCTVALARRFAPLVRKRGLASLADSLGIEVDEVHRALPDALTCARVFCALVPAAVRQRRHGGRRARPAALAPARRARPSPAERDPAATSGPTCRRCPTTRASTSSATSAARPLYVGKSVSLRIARAGPLLRARRAGPSGRRSWTTGPTNSELGALVLENRLIKAVEAGRQQGAQAHRPLLLPALPARHPLPGARGGGRARAGPRRERRAAREPRAGLASSPTSSPRCTGCATAGAS